MAVEISPLIMYKAFNLSDYNCGKSYIDEGAASFFTNKNVVEKTLSDLVRNGAIDGKTLANYWFPKIEADVFISHSHRDQNEAKNLAGFLWSKFGLRCFIDSCVWLYSDDLLKMIDINHCTDDAGKTFRYEDRNGSTSHVHMMLATALGDLLDTTECAIFLNTPNSITSQDSVSKTKSPWIYYELGLIRKIRKKKPERLKILKEALTNMSGPYEARAKLTIDYSVDLSALTPINSRHIDRWIDLRTITDPDAHPLDLLYQAAIGK